MCLSDHTPWMSCALATFRSRKQQQVEEEAELTQAGPSYLDVGDGGCDPCEAIVPKLGPDLLLSILRCA